MSELVRLGEILPAVLADIEKRMQRVAIPPEKAILDSSFVVRLLRRKDARRSMLERAASHEIRGTK